MGESECVFCRIAAGGLQTRKIYEDDAVVAFDDLSPQAPVHVLVIPRVHIESLDKAAEDHKMLLGHLMLTAAGIARSRGIAEDGYRVVVNTNADGGQTVFHLHLHLLGGRPFSFPPG